MSVNRFRMENISPPRKVGLDRTSVLEFNDGRRRFLPDDVVASIHLDASRIPALPHRSEKTGRTCSQDCQRKTRQRDQGLRGNTQEVSGLRSVE